MIAPVSTYAWSFKHSADRSTDSAANEGRCVVFAQVRQPLVVWSSDASASATEVILGGLQALNEKNVGRSIRIVDPSWIYGAATLLNKNRRFGPPITSSPLPDGTRST